MREPQGVASLALGYVLHWAFSPPLLNPKLESVIICLITKIDSMLAYTLASFACVAVQAAWAGFLIHQDNKRATTDNSQTK